MKFGNGKLTQKVLELLNGGKMGKPNIKVVNFLDPDKSKKLIDYHAKGGLPGLELGFNVLNKHYTHKQSGVTDWTGFPSSGKTYFVLETLMQLSERYGKRHGIYVPDLGTYYETMAKLIKMYTGKDFEKKYHNQISLSEMLQRVPQISRDFVVLIKEDYRKPLTPQEFWEYIADYKDELGKLDTGLIDSWKNMSRDSNLQEYQYLDVVLPYRNEIAEEGNVHFHTIAHPNKTEITDNVNSFGNKKRRVPSAQDIKGGDSWYANGKNIITIDRPDDNENHIDIYIWKTKPENVGMKGVLLGDIKLDIKRGRYFETYMGQKCFAYEHEKIKPVDYTPKIEKIKQGIENQKIARESEHYDLPFKIDENENPFAP